MDYIELLPERSCVNPYSLRALFGGGSEKTGDEAYLWVSCGYLVSCPFWSQLLWAADEGKKFFVCYTLHHYSVLPKCVR